MVRICVHTRRVSLREKFREVREANGVSQRSIADAMGVSTQTVWRLENGVTKRIDEGWVARAIEIMASGLGRAA